MRGPPVPQRIPPLAWRKPAFLWTPIALALAVGWPAALFYDDPALQRFAVVAGLAVFAVALSTLGVAWALGYAPNARRIVVAHVVTAGAIASLLAPFVLTELLATIADYEHAGAGEKFTLAMSMTMTPLAIVIGLPMALVSGVLFAWTALVRKRPAGDDLLDDAVFRHDVQPFR
jgi:hypothetical protein